MKKQYDFVYLTNTPSFYKLNLCDAIARRGCSVLIVLYGYGLEAVNTQLADKECFAFDFKFLHYGDAARRNKLVTFWRLLRFMRGIEAKRVLYSGWLAPEYNLYAFLSPRRRNAVVSESSWWDISMTGLAGLIKSAIIGRMSAALPSGEPHKEFFRRIGFRGLIEPTGSVGIFGKAPRVLSSVRADAPRRYLCVARLINVKNLRFLIEQFNRLGYPLTIAGHGKLEAELKAIAGKNITFAGFVENNRIGELYQQHDVFVLPSTYEPWGLVVEEALYWGLPVIVSDRVGAGIDMVERLGTGAVFSLDGGAESFEKAVNEVARNYTKYRAAVASIDWQKREDEQVQAYINLL